MEARIEIFKTCGRVVEKTVTRQFSANDWDTVKKELFQEFPQYAKRTIRGYAI